MFKPELLSPAGTLKNMRYALAYGADAIYAGQPRYSLRVRNNEFNHENLKIGITETHALGKKFYVVLNISPHNAKIKNFIIDLKIIIDMKPDALIMSDPGLIMLARETFPAMPIHLSVQANAVNWATVKFWKQLGLTRVILSRELSLEEIEEIRFQVPEMEIEVFVHGALCMAYSGRCLLSSYINKRDSNQGACTNVCRWKYNVKECNEYDDISNNTYNTGINSIKSINPETNFKKNNNHTFIINEINSSRGHMIAHEDQHGTYIMNSKDLRAIAHVERLAKIGVHSLKIEGRTKSFYYCARTTKAYRKAIDDAVSGKSFDPFLLESLEDLANRGYTEGFLRRHTYDQYQNYEHGHSISRNKQFVGSFNENYKGSLVSVEVKNKFSVGDHLELITPTNHINFILKYMENIKGKSIKVAPGNGYTVWLLLPEKISLQYALLIRNFEKKVCI